MLGRSAEGRLAVVQRYEHRGSTEYGAWEEYRYDALGRRVLTKVRRPNTGQPLAGTNALCTATAGDVCSSYTERVWWAGAAILREARTADSPVNPTNSGEVAYVHAPGVRGIDAPIAVRMGGVVRVLSADWRGLGETSLFPNGAPADNTLPGGPAIALAWPSGRGAYFTPYLNAAPGSWAAHTWAGSLVEHGAGAAGLLYRRNRYYDPQSGRFTQQDPIGLGGGLNVYGFAGGDPVNYSDPFGLCPEDQGVTARRRPSPTARRTRRGGVSTVVELSSRRGGIPSFSSPAALRSKGVRPLPAVVHDLFPASVAARRFPESLVGLREAFRGPSTI